MIWIFEVDILHLTFQLDLHTTAGDHDEDDGRVAQDGREGDGAVEDGEKDHQTELVWREYVSQGKFNDYQSSFFLIMNL